LLCSKDIDAHPEHVGVLAVHSARAPLDLPPLRYPVHAALLPGQAGETYWGLAAARSLARRLDRPVVPAAPEASSASSVQEAAAY
jgi:hypothetical protein